MTKTTAVRKASEAADKLHEEVYGKPNDGAEGDDPATNNAPEGGLDEATLSEVPPSPAEGSPDSPSDGVAPNEPTPVVPAVDDGWEAKYKTLQGMFNAEMPKLQAKVKELDEKNISLTNIIATMETPPVTAGDAPLAEQSLIRPEEIADYGEEMTDYIQRAAKQVMAPEIESIRKENENLKAQNLQLTESVGNVEAERGGNARESLLSSLAGQVPDWQVVNQSQEFIQWLQETDAFSGQIRHNLLLDAFETNDAARTVAFFKSYKRDNAIVSPGDTPPPAAEPTVRLDTLVAPGKGHPQTTQPPSDDGSGQKIWAQSDIQAFYRDVQRGKYAGREAEKARMENSIVKAGREGRVR